MNRYLLPFVLLALGSLGAGCKAKCADVKCPDSQSCDENTALCKDKCTSPQVYDTTTMACKTPTTADCTTMASLCTDAQACDTAQKKCVDNPGAPTATGALMDRMGRPAVNTALTNPFSLYKKEVADAMPESSDATKDRFNKDGNSVAWTTAWGRSVGMHVAIFDGLDKMCGNQAFFNAAGANTYYAALAGVLAGDVIHVDTSKTACNGYLEVETGAAGCGGRKLEYDVVDVTYSVLAGGTSMVSDGITNDSTFLTSFPFLAAPQ